MGQESAIAGALRSSSGFRRLQLYMQLYVLSVIVACVTKAAAEEQHMRLVARVEPTFALARTLGAPPFEPPALLFDVPLVVYRLAYPSQLVTLIRINQTLFASVDTNAKARASGRFVAKTNMYSTITMLLGFNFILCPINWSNYQYCR